MKPHQSDARSVKEIAAALVAKGLALANEGRSAESISCYTEALVIWPNAQAYLHLLHALMAAQRFEDAYVPCKTAIKLFPDEPAFYQVFAALKRAFGKIAEANEIMLTAAASFPDNAELAWECALAYFNANQLTEAAMFVERVVLLRPSVEAFRVLVKVKTRLGKKGAAQRAAVAGRAHFPLDVQLASYCGELKQFDAEAKSRKAMREALDRAATLRSETLRYLVRAQARDNRVSRCLSAHGAENWTDLVRYSDPEGMADFISSLEDELRMPAPRADAALERGAAAVAQMDWAGADRWFAQARHQRAGTLADVTTFDSEFYAQLEKASDQDLWASFPEISELIPRTHWPETMVYVACDPQFFDLYVPRRLLRSFVATGTVTGVHVHLMDGAADDWKRVADVLRGYEGLNISLTAESGARARYGLNARDYYHAARYVRFYQYLAQNKRPIWILDADMAAEADCRPLFKLLGEYEFAAATSAISLEPSAKIRAGIVGFAPTTAGLRYSRLTAAYIAHWYAKGELKWGIDQQALFGAYNYLDQQGSAPKALFMGEKYTNDSDDLPCFIRPILDADRWKKTR